MNSLPDNRRAIHGRTHDRSFRRSDFDPIDRPARPFLSFQDAMAAVVIGALAAAVLLHGLDALWL